MKTKREFGEGPIFTATSYIWWFLVGNFYFWLMNIPMLLVLLGIVTTDSKDNTMLVIITLLPMAPAWTALISSMGKLVREKDINITKDYFKAYKTNFFDSIIFGLIEVIILMMMYIDRMFLAQASSSSVLQMAVLILAVIIFSTINFYILPIVSRFYLKKMQIVRLSVFYLIRRIHVAASGLAILYLVWTISVRGASIILLFAASILCYVIMLFQKNTMAEIEERLEPNNTSV